MLRYAFDLYPRLDPRDGAVIRRLEHLQEASFKDEENGTGAGQFVINGGSPDADDIDPLGLDYVRVVEIDDLDAERVVGGFFLDSGDYEALTRRETRKLKLGGAGTLSYLQRAVMWSRSYISTGAIFTQDPIGETWDLSAQTVILAAGNHLGAMLWRVVHEAQSFRSGSYTHIHYDGTQHTGTHADDRTESAIPDLVMTFTGFLDSDGNPWTLTAGDFKAQVGESVLDVTRRLMELGLRVEMDPDTFELHAWEAPHRTDRTSATWAANKVRFQAPIGQDVATGNILSDTNRKVRAYIQRSVVLAGGQNTYAISQGSNEPPWEGGYRLDTTEDTTPAAVASRQRLARSDAVDNVKLVFKLGDDELDGYYRPWDHVSPGDLVTLHTGTETWEYDEQTFPVAGLTVELKEGGDWRGIVELGSSFTSLLEPAFRTGGPASHSHPPNPALCIAGFSVDLAYLGDVGFACSNVATDFASDHPAWSGDREQRVEITSAITIPAGSTVIAAVSCPGEIHSGDEHLVYDEQGHTYIDDGQSPPQGSADRVTHIYRALVTDTIHVGDYIRFAANVGGGAAGNSHGGRCISVGAWNASLSSPVEGTNAQGFNATPTVANSATGDVTVMGVTIPDEAAGGVTEDADWESMNGYDGIGGSGNLANGLLAQYLMPGTGDGYTAGIDQSRDWTLLSIGYTASGTGSYTGDGPAELVGSASRAARCDHNHLIETLLTDETDTDLRLAPDGSGGVSWETSSSIVLSDDTPLVESGLGDPGVSTEASRSDHEHPADAGGGGGSVTTYAASLQRSAGLTLAVAGTIVSWDVEERDDGGLWASGNPTRMVAPVDGWYQVDAWMGATTSADSMHNELLLTPAAGGGPILVAYGRSYETTNGVARYVSVHRAIYLLAGDYLEYKLITGAADPVIVTVGTNGFSMICVK